MTCDGDILGSPPVTEDYEVEEKNIFMEITPKKNNIDFMLMLRPILRSCISQQTMNGNQFLAVGKNCHGSCECKEFRAN